MQLQYSLAGLAFTPTFLILSSEFLNLRTIPLGTVGHPSHCFRLNEMVDALFVGPFVIFTMLSLREYVRSAWKTIVLLLAFIFAYGHGIHFAANIMNVYIYEVQHELYHRSVPRDLDDLIYFLDEDWGHFLTFFPLYTLLAMLTWKSHKRLISQKRICSAERFLVLLSGACFGFTHAFGIIESSHPWIALYLWTLLFAACASHRFNFDLVFVNFSVALLLVMSATMTLYYKIIGSFAQPSQLGHMKGVVNKFIEATKWLF